MGFTDFTEVAELGIACEACHGPGEAHVNKMRELADRVVVLRDGENAGELQRDEITHDNMVKLMQLACFSSVFLRLVMHFWVE